MSGAKPQVPDLIEFARSRFDRLSKCELKILSAATSGGFAYCGPSASGDDPRNNPAMAAGWGDERTIRASVIRWMCGDREAKNLVDPHGIWIHAARIEHLLDLAFLTVPFPLIFDNCLFADPIILQYSKLQSFYLRACRTTAPILAVGVSVCDDLLVRDGEAEGEVRLTDAVIGGNLLCDHQTFQKGLQAAGIETSGSVSFRNNFKAENEVRLTGAVIGGYLDCENGSFTNPRGVALAAAGLKVRRSVFLRNGFNAAGQVNLIDAEIGGTFECDKGAFKNAGGVALYADRIKVGGAVYLRYGFSAEGEVRLLGANISGNLGCNQGIFTNVSGIALFASDMKVTGSIFLRDGVLVEGEVRLVAAEVGGAIECAKGTFKNAGGYAVCANGIKVNGPVALGEGASFDGEVSFVRANIGGAFGSVGSQFAANSTVNIEQVSIAGSFFWQKVSSKFKSENNAESDSALRSGLPVRLNLQHSTVGPMADDNNSWPSIGRLHLDGLVYTRIAAGPTDARSRLEWLRRQGDGFWPQPYRQLAKVLGEVGDESGTRRVLIAMENSRLKYGKLSWYSRVWVWALRLTIGYGYQPFRAGWWVTLFVLIGFFLFSWGQDAGVLTQIPSPNAAAYQPFNGFVFSLETFVPLVDLQFAKHWLPGAELHPRGAVDLLKPISRYRLFSWLPNWEHQFGSNFGERLRWYFWGHILAGWFFTTMFVAGVTGLIRKD